MRLLLAKTKEKYEENFFLGFYFKTQKCPFLWVNQFFSKFYFLVLAFKTIDTQMLFDQYFWKRVFDSQSFFLLFQNTNQKNICMSIVSKIKVETQRKKFFGRFSLKTKNALFLQSKKVLFKSQISNLYFCVCSLM